MSTDDQIFELYKIAFTAAINDQTQGELDQDAVVAIAEALTSRAAKGFERVCELARSPSERVHSEHSPTLAPPPPVSIIRG